MAANDHVEVLADGASAIYGSDAVAGVVNIILKKSFDGGETSLRYGAPTRGDDKRFNASQLLGKSWGSGNALIVYDYDNQTGLRADQRDFAPAQGGRVDLLPATRRNSVFLEANQDLGASASLSLMGNYSNRKTAFVVANYATPTFAPAASQNVNNWGANGSLTQKLGGGWEAVLSGGYSRISQASINDIALFHDTLFATWASSTGAANLGASGPVVRLPGGMMRAAFGVSGLWQQAWEDGTGLLNGAACCASMQRLRRSNQSFYGELYVPLVGADCRTVRTRGTFFMLLICSGKDVS